MNYKILSFFIFLLFSIGLVTGSNLNFQLETAYPDSAPYYLGTQVKSMKIWITEDNKKIDVDNTYIELKIGSEKFKLLKKDKVFSYNTLFYIKEENLKSGNLILEVLTPISGITNKLKSYSVIDPQKIITYSINDLKDTYNANQNVNLKLNFDMLKEGLTDLTCFLIKPQEKNNKFSCNDNSCNIQTKIPSDANNNYNLEMFCHVTTDDLKVIPIYISKEIKLSEDININILNPENGIVRTPLFVKFNVTYPNGLPLDNKSFELTLNNDKKKVTILDDGYRINYILMPYTDFNKTFIIQYNDKTYKKNIFVELKPDLWFWFILVFILVIIIVNIVILLLKVFKKEDLNELIAERNLYVDKLGNIKKDYLAGQLTKASYNEVIEDLEFKIAYLNSKIVKMKKISPKDQLKQISKIKETNILEAKGNNPDDLLKVISNPSAPKMPSVNTEIKQEKQSFFKKLFSKNEVSEKSTEQKLEVVKKTIPKQNTSNDSELDINSWKK